MDYRFPQGLNIKTSLLGFGGMRFPEIDGKIDHDKAVKLIDLAMASGINYYDTAYVYHNGQSETCFRDTLVRRYPRDSFFIADKLPVWCCNTPQEMDSMFDTQLERLGVDCIDFYLLHSMTFIEWQRMKSLGVQEWLLDKRARGQIRFIGFSSHDNPEGFRSIVEDWDEWQFAQLQVNYFDWEALESDKTYKMLEEKGLPLIIMEPIRGGNLANLKPEIGSIFQQANPGRSNASYALRWVGELGNTAVVLSGMGTLEQIEENARTYSPLEPLSEREHALIARVLDALNKLSLIPCTNCGYCGDCPQELNIPFLFSCMNSYVKFDDTGYLTWRYLYDSPSKKTFEHCVECGQCSAICPQHIDIPAELKKIHELTLDLVNKK